MTNLLATWTWVLLAIASGEEAHLQSLVDRSMSLQLAATEEEVLRVLGEPSIRWKERTGLSGFFFGSRPRQWVYGTTIDMRAVVVPGLPFPNPVPINLRLFSADERDLVIEWTPEMRVSAVNRPSTQMPDSVAQFFEPLFAVADLCRAFGAN